MKNFARIISIALAVGLLFGALCVLGACNTLTPFEKTVKYSQFGAVGDGVTDDFAAICATHEYANENNIAVAADKGAMYYIGGDENDAKTHEKSAVIKTNTYWQDAMFIIDDKNITSSKIKGTDIFTVKSFNTEEKVTLPDGYSLKAGQKNVGLKFNESKLLYIVNKNHKDFIRSGADQNNGTDRQEVILVDRNGKVSSSTPITWDYDQVTSMVAYSVNDPTLTISGGQFLTIEIGVYMGYVNRGINVCRSNVIVKNVTHTVSQETPDGSPYSGFYRAERASNVKFEKCTMWGRCTPIHNGSTQGTYDISAKLANNVTWKNCTQGNSIKTGWGVMGSNHSRNLTMDGCTLSRFDAHQGVYNATIKNSELNAITVVGFGTLRIENVNRNCLRDADYGEADFVTLRNDYGAFWHGDVIMKNCVVNTNAAINYLIKINWKYDWDYGYQCAMPTTVTINNVTVNYSGHRNKPYPYFYVFSNLDLTQTLTPEMLASMQNPMLLTQKVVVKNCSTEYLLTHNKKGILDNVQFVQK